MPKVIIQIMKKTLEFGNWQYMCTTANLFMDRQGKLADKTSPKKWVLKTRVPRFARERSLQTLARLEVR
jgi:hypothetical protein